MTIEEANRRALAAAEAGDLNKLNQALRARRAAIATLKREPASSALATRIGEAIAAGQAVARALFLHKQRLGFESARLAMVAEGIRIGCGAERSRPNPTREAAH